MSNETATASIEVSQKGSDNAISIYKNQKSIPTLIISASGAGKSFSMFNLPPEKTFLINIMGKQLPFMGAFDYIEETNMLSSADYSKIIRAMKMASDNKYIEYLIIDDMQYIMATEFMNTTHIKGFDKWNDMAKHIWEIILLSSKLRPGLKVFLLTHEDDDGRKRKMKTLGRLLEDKITPEGLVTIVLFAEVGGTRDKRSYFFSTQSDGYTTAKSPYDMFPSKIPNDLKLVSDRIDEYYSRIPLKNSKINMEVK